MMRLYVLGSGSRGNCCAIETDGASYHSSSTVRDRDRLLDH